MTRKGWDGRPVPEGETPDTVVTAWEVTPHLQTDRYDCLVERDGSLVRVIVADNLEYWLESFTEEELREGVNLRFRLVSMPLEELVDEDV